MNFLICKPRFLLLFSLFFYLSVCLMGQNNGENNQSGKKGKYDFIENSYRHRKSALAVSFYTNSFDVTLWDRSIISGNTGYGIHTSYERKLGKRHSLGTGTQLFIDNKKDEYVKLYGTYRFYHNLNKRMQLGQTGDNFSANYIFIETSYNLNRGPYKLSHYTWDYSKNKWKLIYKKMITTYTRFWVGYGIQRNFYSNFYIDANAGFDFQDYKNISHPHFRLYLFTQLSIGYIIH